MSTVTGVDARVTGACRVDRRTKDLAKRLRPGEIAVIDHGRGLDEAAAAKLFTPFFTTKDEGMGMGLNISRTSVEFHRGRLWFEPTPGGGATFRFTLPT